MPRPRRPLHGRGRGNHGVLCICGAGGDSNWMSVDRRTRCILPGAERPGAVGRWTWGTREGGKYSSVEREKIRVCGRWVRSTSWHSISALSFASPFRTTVRTTCPLSAVFSLHRPSDVSLAKDGPTCDRHSFLHAETLPCPVCQHKRRHPSL